MPSAGACLLFAAGVAGLLDREDDVVGQLREQHDVGDVGVECVLQQARGASGGEQDYRRLRVLANRRHVVRRQSRAARRVQHNLQVSSRQRGGAFEDVVAPAHQLDLGVLRERLAQVREPVANARHEYADAVLARRFHVIHAHRRPPSVRGRGARPG